MARKYLLETFGCQMNFHDGERMAGLLEADGSDQVVASAREMLAARRTIEQTAKGESENVRQAKAKGRRRGA